MLRHPPGMTRTATLFPYPPLCRPSTPIPAGELQLRRRGSTVLGQNVLAAAALTLGMSVALVIITGLVSVGLGLGPTIGLSDLLVVSVAGGALASLPVL